MYPQVKKFVLISLSTHAFQSPLLNIYLVVILVQDAKMMNSIVETVMNVSSIVLQSEEHVDSQPLIVQATLIVH